MLNSISEDCNLHNLRALERISCRDAKDARAAASEGRRRVESLVDGVGTVKLGLRLMRDIQLACSVFKVASCAFRRSWSAWLDSLRGFGFFIVAGAGDASCRKVSDV